jgi:hypothetical protein
MNSCFLVSASRLGSLESLFSAKLDALTQELRSGFQAVNSLIDGIDKKLIVIEGDLRTFHSVTGNHEGRLSSLEG